MKFEGDPLKKEEEEEEEEAVFIRGVNTNEDSPNAQHAPHRPVQDTGAMSAEEEEAVFTRENRGGSAQRGGGAGRRGIVHNTAASTH